MKLHVETRPIEADDAFALLRDAPVTSRGYWDDGETVVFWGEAVVLTAEGPRRFIDIQEQAAALFEDLDAAADVRVFGAFAFGDGPLAPPWDGLAAARFVVPEVQVRWRDGQAFETRVRFLGSDGTATDPIPVPPTRNGQQQTDETGWNEAVRRALDGIHGGRVSKIVLARGRKGRAVTPIDFLGLLCQKEPDTTRFLLSVGDRAFCGATPEVLVAHHDGHVHTHALAGSAARGDDPAADDALGEALMRSGKEVLEHELVVSYLRGHLNAVGATDIQQRRRILRKLQNVQHLETPIDARVEGKHILDLVGALHPTPAVCGLPPNTSRALIEELEAFDRGWYTGAVGWFDGNGNGHFAVALRSALCTPDATWLFAGAGIVAGSDPEKEWDETEVKLRTLRQALREAAGRVEDA